MQQALDQPLPDLHQTELDPDIRQTTLLLHLYPNGQQQDDQSTDSPGPDAGMTRILTVLARKAAKTTC